MACAATPRGYRAKRPEPPPPGAAPPAPLIGPRFRDWRLDSSDDDGEADDAVACAVCLGPLRSEGCFVAEMPGCGHLFHAACAHEWLRRTPSCPLCRGAVPSYASHPFALPWPHAELLDSVAMCVESVEGAARDMRARSRLLDCPEDAAEACCVALGRVHQLWAHLPPSADGPTAHILEEIKRAGAHLVADAARTIRKRAASLPTAPRRRIRRVASQLKRLVLPDISDAM